jgi:very-short-patch-repair endonuclease
MSRDKYGLPAVCLGAPVTSIQRDRARWARKHPTDAERVAWELLRARRCWGLRFRRQQPIGPFIVDFYCPELRIALEVDGGVHDDPDQRAWDELREGTILGLGVVVLRIRNEQVSLENLAALLAPYARGYLRRTGARIAPTMRAREGRPGKDPAPAQREPPRRAVDIPSPGASQGRGRGGVEA